MTPPEYLSTWAGTMSASGLEGLFARVAAPTFIGQRAGDFTLDRELTGGAAAWPSGRCFNEDLEIRWWPGDDLDERGVLILNRLPDGWEAPHGWARSHLLACTPVKVPYLCVGHYDEGADQGVHEWWEARYSRPFCYLDSAPPAQSGSDDGYADRHGRVHLVTMVYELDDGRSQHRLVRFEHVPAKDGA